MEKSKINIEYIRKIAEEVSVNSFVPYEDLPRYDLFMSQVIEYLNDKFTDEKLTNSIVQNYIRGEVISKPDEGKKRGYTKQHLAQLILLNYMRPVLTLEEIKKVYKLAFNEINDRCDDIISWEQAYRIFSDIQRNSLSELLKVEYFDEASLNRFIEENNLNAKDQEIIMVFLLAMTLIAQASSIKKLVQKIVSEYNN